MIQRGLFDQPEPDPPAQRHSATSVAAADAIRPNAETLRREVLAYIESCGEDGATREEIELKTGIPGNTVRPRVCELMTTGWIHETAKTRKTTSGRAAFVLVANRLDEQKGTS